MYLSSEIHLPLTLRLLLLAVLLLVPRTSARAEKERVISYDCAIKVQDARIFRVHDTIKFYCGGKRIKYGVYRHFPIGPATDGCVANDVSSVSLNGQPAIFSSSTEDDGKAELLAVGDEDTPLRPGFYTCELQYCCEDRLLPAQDHGCTLKWSVTGTDWQVPIEKVTVSVSLPSECIRESIRPSCQLGFGGREFTTRTDDSGNTVHFATTRALQPGEDMIVSVAWKDAELHPAEPDAAPSGPEEQADSSDVQPDAPAGIVSDAGLITGLAGAALLLAYYILIWRRLGRDPARKTTVPIWDPPGNLSPAVMRSIFRRRCDNKSVAAAVANAVYKKAVSVERDEQGRYQLRRLGGHFSELSPDEHQLISDLTRGTRLQVAPLNSGTISKSIENFSALLMGNFYERYYRMNRQHLLYGIIASILFCAVVIFLRPGPDVTMLGRLELVGIWLGLSAVLLVLGNGLMQIVAPGGHKAGNPPNWQVFLLHPIVFGGGGLLALGGVQALAVGVVLATINIIFAKLLKCYTPEGMDIYNQILGFRMYLSTAEEEGLKAIGGPDKTPELYEKFLPYAIALDVHEQWGSRFSHILNKSMSDFWWL